MRRIRIAVQLNDGAADALEWLTTAQGETVTSSVNAALRELASARRAAPADLPATVERLVADVAELRRIVAAETRSAQPAADTGAEQEQGT